MSSPSSGRSRSGLSCIAPPPSWQHCNHAHCDEWNLSEPGNHVFVQPLGILPPAQLSSRRHVRRRACRHAGKDSFPEPLSPGKAQHDAGDHAVSGTHFADDRYRRWMDMFGELPGNHQSTGCAERNDQNWTSTRPPSSREPRDSALPCIGTPGRSCPSCTTCGWRARRGLEK